MRNDYIRTLILIALLITLILGFYKIIQNLKQQNILLKNIDANTKLVIAPNPFNPTGNQA